MKSPCSLAKLVMTAFVGAALTGCGAKPIVGVLLPMTGSASTYGESMKQGIDLALDVEGDKLPSGFQTVWGDTASDPETGVSELRRLTDLGATLVVAGTTSGTARALLPILDETDSIILSPSASAPDLTKDSRRFFRVFSSDELEGRRAGRFLYEDQDRETVLIFAEDSEQARGIEPPFRQVFEGTMGGEVVGRVIVGSADWQKEAADLLAAHRPESVYVIAYGETTINVLRFLREKAFDGVICASSAFYTADIIEHHPDLVEGVFFPQPAFDIKDERETVLDFVTTFRKRNHHDPDIYAAHAFDAMRIAVETVRQTRVCTSNEIRKTLQFGIKEFPGVTGVIQFDEYGDVKHNPIMFIIKDGQVLNYERFVKEEKEKIRKKIEKLLRG